MALNQSSEEGNEGMKFQQSEQQDPFDSQTWERAWGFGSCYTEYNVACPSREG